jgi:hypothetical protein
MGPKCARKKKKRLDFQGENIEKEKKRAAKRSWKL